MSPSRRADRPWEQVGLAGKSSSLADAAWSPGHIRAQNCRGGKAAVWGSWKWESGGWPFRFSFNRFAASSLHFLRTDFYKHLCQCSPFWMLQMNPFIPSSLEPGLCGKRLLDSSRWVSKHFTQKRRARGRAGRRKGEMWHVQVEGNGGPQERLWFWSCFLGFGNSHSPKTDTSGREGAFPQLGNAQMLPRSKGEGDQGGLLRKALKK